MAKKKTAAKPKGLEEKLKPIDRTPIIVAIIGLIGTVTVALITTFANRAVESATPAASTEESNLAASVTDVPASSQNDSACFGSYLASVPSQNQADVQAGVSKRITGGDGAYGIRLFENGQLLGGMIFVGTSDSNSFSVTSVVNEACQPASTFGNLERPSAKNAIGNWENLGITFSEGNYRVRMGWYGSAEIELLFAANP